MYKLIKASSLLLSVFLLTACSSSEPIYLAKSTPIVNIDVTIATQLNITAQSDKLVIKNKQNKPINVSYGLFWYSANGVGQFASTHLDKQKVLWHPLHLNPKQSKKIQLIKPTIESVNYRIYVMAQHSIK